MCEVTKFEANAKTLHEAPFLAAETDTISYIKTTVGMCLRVILYLS
jgi:hypothetical protein